MSINQAMLDRIRVVNKHMTNKLLIHLAGTDIGLFAVLTHVGRKSGKSYKIPIIVEPVDNGFVIALTYGKKVDWYENVKAKGGCSLKWRNKDYELTDPKFMDPGVALQAFPAVFRIGLRMMGIQYYLRLSNSVLP